MLGELVKTFAEGMYEAGYYNIEFDAAGLSSGTYIYRLESNNFTETKKMILIRQAALGDLFYLDYNININKKFLRIK